MSHIVPSYIADMSITTALGFSHREHTDHFRTGKSGLISKSFSFGDRYVGAIDDQRLEEERRRCEIPDDFTRFESLVALNVGQLIRQNEALKDRSFLLILASTKGNIDHLESGSVSSASSVHLSITAQKIRRFFGLHKQVLIVSNACTSGVAAAIVAHRMIRDGLHRDIVVCGADIVSEFTLRGFSSLQAYDDRPCRPYDESRKGITLGEGCGAMWLTKQKVGSRIGILGGGIRNDAGHITGPSRTGEGLTLAVRAALRSAGQPPLDSIHAHGTATPYNDEMEAQAFHRLGLSSVPLWSSKRYWGHTLGAAGVIEIIASALLMQEGLQCPSLGYSQHGLSLPLSVVTSTKEASYRYCLKTSSGFGGGNAAIVLKKDE